MSEDYDWETQPLPPTAEQIIHFLDGTDRYFNGILATLARWVREGKGLIAS